MDWIYENLDLIGLWGILGTGILLLISSKLVDSVDFSDEPTINLKWLIVFYKFVGIAIILLGTTKLIIFYW